MIKQKVLTLLVLLAAVVTGAWAQEQSETIATTAKIVEGTHFTISNNDSYVDENGMNADAGITVTSKNGETITKVVISCIFGPTIVNDGNTSVSSGTKEITNDGETCTVTVTGVNASTFTFTCSNDGPTFVQFVVYYTEASAAPAGYTVSMPQDTPDAEKWTARAGTDGTYQQLPLEGVAAGTAVSVKYSGKKRVKSVKAVKEVTDLSMVDCAGNNRTDGQWTANCYMVHTAGDYKLPLVYGNAIKAGQTNDAAYTGVENANTTLTFPRHDGEAITGPWIKDNGITVTQAELLWQDAEGLVTAVGIDGDYLTLTVGENADEQEGNALIAAKDGDDNVVWSWHIWVTKQTFAAADLTTVATGSHNYTVTPVNLGWVGDAKSATGYSTFYQWGRKDPFKGTGTVTLVSSNTATIADNIKNPMTFYFADYKPSNTTYYNMWDAQQTGTDAIATATVKTVYDPSPAGFCVPTGNLYYYMKNGSGVSFGWDGENKGSNLTSVTPNVFFPASGYRKNSDGSLSSVGSASYCWAASAVGSNASTARSLYFSSSNWIWSGNYRSSGFPVRAVAEE